MEKKLSLADAINYVLNYDEFYTRYDEYELMYQLAILAHDHKAAAFFFKARASLIPGKEFPKPNEEKKVELLKKLTFPHSFKYEWNDLSEVMQDVINLAIIHGNDSAVNVKALALANQCPCTGWSNIEDNPSDPDDSAKLKKFVDFATQHSSKLRKDILWLLNYATAEKRRKAPEMDFSITDLKKSEQAPDHATEEEWKAYRDMIRMERSYVKRLETLENIDRSALNKHLAAQLLHHERSIINFTGDNKYRIEKDRRMDRQTGINLYAMAAAEGCHNSRWDWE